MPLLFRTVFLALSIHVARLRAVYLVFILLVVAAFAILWAIFLMPQPGFPATIVVEHGESITRAANDLAQKHLLSSPFLFKVIVRLTPGAHGVESGTYQFPEPEGLLQLASDFAFGTTHTPGIRVTFPEGTTVRQMGTMLAADIQGFGAERFNALALPNEGTLFPDTYFFAASTSEAEALATMQANYRVHIEKYRAAIASSGHSERDIVIMASLLEGEGKTLEDKRLIAGILWHRIAIGMPLQVDAAFSYIHGTTGYVPAASDLKSTSPYNTYRYRGLPPTPINNPGEVSLDAALTPEATDYLYYLTGSDGQMHYAKTLDEHVANEKRYLK